MVYLDASALVSLFLADANSDVVGDFISGFPDAIAVGDFASAEFASAASRRVRTGEITADQALRVLSVHDAWVKDQATRIPVEGADVRLAAAFVRRFELGLRAPDALHLAVCRRLGASILAFDRQQAGAARALGIATADATVAE